MPSEFVTGGVTGAVVGGSDDVAGSVVAVESGVLVRVVVEESEVRTLVVVMSPGTVVSDGIDDVVSPGTEEVAAGLTVVAGVAGESLDDEKNRKPTTERTNTTAIAPSVTGVKEMFFSPPVRREIGDPEANPSGSLSFLIFFTFLALPSVGAASAESRRRRAGDSAGIVGDGPNEPGCASWNPPGCAAGCGTV
jgi:hypothetical protein